MSPAGKEKVLYSFTGSADGANPRAGLIRDSAKNLYGTTTSGNGTVFKLDKTGKLTVLDSFEQGDGWSPEGSLVRDPAGNLYGVTIFGGAVGCGSTCGVVIFKVDPNGKETVLHTFAGGPTDGGMPSAGLIRDANGNLYGTTLNGGISGFGIVIKLTP